MGFFALKIVIAIIVALFLLWLARRWIQKNTCADRVLRSLPGSLVQQIADRLEQPEALQVFLSDFFKHPYHGDEKSAADSKTLSEMLAPFAIPADELEDLFKVIHAIEPEDLLAYAVKLPEFPEAPAIITICRGSEEQGLLVGVYQPQ